MLSTEVGIVGGGLAGVYAAFKLQRQGVPFLLFESNKTLGGRIASAISADLPKYFHDLGPTWIFEHQDLAKSLVHDLALNLFDQYTQGDVLYQLAGSSTIKRMAGQAAMTMHRIEGGTMQLIHALQQHIDPANIYLSSHVQDIRKIVANQITQHEQHWQLTTSNQLKVNCRHLMLAIPPRVIANTFAHEKSTADNSKGEHILSLIAGLQKALLATPTWMAAQAKFVAIYKSPFWRKQGLSGQAFSQVGPMVEMHDASCTSHVNEQHGGYALFGFIGIPAKHRQQVSSQQLQDACLQQLHALYGDEALHHQGIFLKDWSQSPLICTESDINDAPQHPNFNMNFFEQSLQTIDLHLIASEFAKQDPGYLEGAIHAVDEALKSIKR